MYIPQLRNTHISKLLFCAGLALSVAVGACDEGKSDGSETSNKQEKGQTPNSKKKDADDPSGSKGDEGDQDKPENSPKTKKSGGAKSKGVPDEEKSSDSDSEGKTSAAPTGGEEGTSEDKSSDSTDTKDESESDQGPISCEGKSPKVVMETSMGKLVIQLDGEKAPITVENFIQYVNDKFYDDTIFHRIIDDFVVQGGGHGLDGKLKDARPPIKLEIHPDLVHVDGSISMARTNEKDSANSQFFLCDGDNRNCRKLNGDYAVFGQTIEGLDIIAKMSAVKVDGQSKPYENVVLQKAYCIK